MFAHILLLTSLIAPIICTDIYDFSRGNLGRMKSSCTYMESRNHQSWTENEVWKYPGGPMEGLVLTSVSKLACMETTNTISLNSNHKYFEIFLRTKFTNTKEFLSVQLLKRYKSGKISYVSELVHVTKSDKASLGWKYLTVPLPANLNGDYVVQIVSLSSQDKASVRYFAFTEHHNNFNFIYGSENELDMDFIEDNSTETTDDTTSTEPETTDDTTSTEPETTTEAKTTEPETTTEAITTTEIVTTTEATTFTEPETTTEVTTTTEIETTTEVTTTTEIETTTEATTITEPETTTEATTTTTVVTTTTETTTPEVTDTTTDTESTSESTDSTSLSSTPIPEPEVTTPSYSPISATINIFLLSFSIYILRSVK